MPLYNKTSDFLKRSLFFKLFFWGMHKTRDCTDNYRIVNIFSRKNKEINYFTP